MEGIEEQNIRQNEIKKQKQGVDRNKGRKLHNNDKQIEVNGIKGRRE